MLSPRTSTPRRCLLGQSPLRRSRTSAGTSKVRVVSRVRPFLPAEVEKDLESCIVTRKGEVTVDVADEKNGQSESFRLDSCYGETDAVKQIFKEELEPVLPLLFCGCNATVFACGATGSGKTYTMQGSEDEPGLMILAVSQILSLAEGDPKCRVDVSFYELYMERCYDLLEIKAGELPVLEDAEGNIQLRGLAKIEVKSMKDFEDLFAKGCAHRKTGVTGLNRASSRSHSVLMITVTKSDGNQPNVQLTGKLSLIDLAGNEDNRKTGNDGVRLAESGRINQSLFVLSNVINALNTNERRVPYRDSKLTRVLQNSLGGTSSALMIACLSPGSFTEATQTLSLAARSRGIETPKKKLDMDKFKDVAKRKAIGSPLSRSSPLQNRLPVKSPSLTRTNLPTDFSSCDSTARNIEDPTVLTSIVEDLPVCDKKPSKDVNQKVSDTSASSPEQNETICSAVSEKDAEESILCTPTDTRLEPSSSRPLSSMLRNFGTSLREVLTPLSTNGAVVRNLEQTPTFNEEIDLSTCKKRLDSGWTAVERFNSSRRGLQGRLLQDYLEILNTGTREDLLTLKGIGPKRADAIMNLRESSPAPFNQLRDLQQIGMSAKQAERLFQNNLVQQVLNLSQEES